MKNSRAARPILSLQMDRSSIEALDLLARSKRITRSRLVGDLIARELGQPAQVRRCRPRQARAAA